MSPASDVWPWEVAERDHDLQNPTSPEKIRLLGDDLRLANRHPVREGRPALSLGPQASFRLIG